MPPAKAPITKGTTIPSPTLAPKLKTGLDLGGGVLILAGSVPLVVGKGGGPVVLYGLRRLSPVSLFPLF